MLAQLFVAGVVLIGLSFFLGIIPPSLIPWVLGGFLLLAILAIIQGRPENRTKKKRSGGGGGSSFWTGLGNAAEGIGKGLGALDLGGGDDDDDSTPPGPGGGSGPSVKIVGTTGSPKPGGNLDVEVKIAKGDRNIQYSWVQIERSGGSTDRKSLGASAGTFTETFKVGPGKNKISAEAGDGKDSDGDSMTYNASTGGSDPAPDINNLRTDPDPPNDSQTSDDVDIKFSYSDNSGTGINRVMVEVFKGGASGGTRLNNKIFPAGSGNFKQTMTNVLGGTENFSAGTVYEINVVVEDNNGNVHWSNHDFKVKNKSDSSTTSPMGYDLSNDIETEINELKDAMEKLSDLIPDHKAEVKLETDLKKVDADLIKNLKDIRQHEKYIISQLKSLENGSITPEEFKNDVGQHERALHNDIQNVKQDLQQMKDDISKLRNYWEVDEKLEKRLGNVEERVDQQLEGSGESTTGIVEMEKQLEHIIAEHMDNYRDVTDGSKPPINAQHRDDL